MFLHWEYQPSTTHYTSLMVFLISIMGLLQVIDDYALGSTTHRLQVTVASVAKEDRSMREKTFLDGKQSQH